MYDDSHYKAALLLCLSRVRVDPHSRQTQTQSRGNGSGSGSNERNNERKSNESKNVLDSSEGEDSDKYRGDDSSGIGILKRISLLASTFLQADIVYARGKARMSRSQHINDACSVAILSSGGIVAAAALSCLVEIDIQVISADATPTTDVPSSPLSFTHGLGGISGIDFTEYFLPAIERDKLRHEGSKARFKKSPVFPLCSPVVREAALEAHVRICFAQYLLLADKQKKVAADPTQKAFYMKTNEISAFIASAVDATLQVVNTDPHRSVRRRAATTLFHTIQNAPSGQPAFAAYSLGEPWLCAGWADTDALLLQHPGGINSAVTAARQVR